MKPSDFVERLQVELGRRFDADAAAACLSHAAANSDLLEAILEHLTAMPETTYFSPRIIATTAAKLRDRNDGWKPPELTPDERRKWAEIVAQCSEAMAGKPWRKVLSERPRMARKLAKEAGLPWAFSTFEYARACFREPAAPWEESA